MALIPRSVYRNWWDDIDRYHREIEEHFDKITVRDYDKWPTFPSWSTTIKPWRRWPLLDLQVDASAIVERDDNKYQVTVNVQQFAPEEITVRTDDRCITIEGKHHQRKDGQGYISRQFVRRYLVPRDYDMCNVKPSLSSDGILTITAPKLPLPRTRFLPIRRTYLPVLRAA